MLAASGFLDSWPRSLALALGRHRHRFVDISQFPTPLTWYNRLALRLVSWEQCEGVPLAIASFGDESVVRARVAGALRLIAIYAPADFARIRVRMRGIIITRLYGSRAEWRQQIRTCLVSTHYLVQEEASPESVAGTIIHELTHARLDALGFDYGEKRRARIERICFHASKRFLERLSQSTARDAALAAVGENLSLDNAEWSDAAFAERQAEQPWYVRANRFIFRQLGA